MKDSSINIAPRFSSSVEDIEENALDLNKYLIKHKAATFFIRMDSDAMVLEGVHKNDLLVVDRSLTPSKGKVIVAVINGELQVNKAVKLEEGDYIWGVVTAIIRTLS